MNKFEEIKVRFLAGWITAVQLNKYVALGVITAAEAEEILKIKSINPIDEQLKRLTKVGENNAYSSDPKFSQQ